MEKFNVESPETLLQKLLAEKATVFMKLAMSAFILNEGWEPGPDEDRYFIACSIREDEDEEFEGKAAYSIETEEYNELPLHQVFFKTEALAQKVLDSLSLDELELAFGNSFKGLVSKEGKIYLEFSKETIEYCAQALIDQHEPLTSQDVVDAGKEAGYWATHDNVDITLFTIAKKKGWTIVREKTYNEYYQTPPAKTIPVTPSNELDLTNLISKLLGGIIVIK